MDKPFDFSRDAPAILHTKLDRVWIVREDDGAVTHTTTVRDPDNPNVSYRVTFSVHRQYA